MKNSKMITILAVIALIAIVVVTLVSGTFARYATTANDTATATTAAWSFSAGFGTDKTTTIDLYNTLTKANYPNLTENTIAPGTSGEFSIVIDATGSEVGVDYTLDIVAAAGSTIPDGLIFTIGTEAMTEGDTVQQTGTIALANVGTVKTIPVTWEWTYGDNEAQDNSDEGEETGHNNGDAAKTVTLDVTIRGEQHIGAI